MFFQETFRVFVPRNGRAEFLCLRTMYRRRAPVWSCTDMFVLAFRVEKGMLRAEFRGLSSRTIEFYFPDSGHTLCLSGEAHTHVLIPITSRVRLNWIIRS